MSLSDKAVDNILNRLQGYVLVEDSEDSSLEDLNYDNAVTRKEIDLFYGQALSESLNYCYLVNFPIEKVIDEHGEESVDMNPIFQEAVFMWCSGLIWRKYDIRANDQIEESNALGYGDSLIINAKQLLKPFRHMEFAVW